MARTGCAFCFVTLEPDPADARGEPVCCAGCRRPYHRNCSASEAGPRCVSPHCAVPTSLVPVALPAPAPLNLNWMAADPHSGGPVNTLDDVPLGLSSGQVGDLGGEFVGVRNNGPEEVWVRRLFFALPWAEVDLVPTALGLSDQAPEIAEHHTVAPKEAKTLRVRLSPVRPVDAERSLWLSGQEVVVCSAPHTGACLFFAAFGLFALLLLHLWSAVRAAGAPDPGYFRVALTFGLALGYTALMSPGWLRGAGLIVLDGVFAPIDELLPKARPIATAYNWLHAPSAGPSGRWARLLLLAALVTLLATLVHWVLFAGLTVSALGAASDSTFKLIGAGLLYAFLLLLMWSWWLGKFGLFDWLWNGLARRVREFGQPVAAQAPRPMAPASPAPPAAAQVPPRF